MILTLISSPTPQIYKIEIGIYYLFYLSFYISTSTKTYSFSIKQLFNEPST